MASLLDAFEQIVRRAHSYDDRDEQDRITLHAFDLRNIYPDFPEKVRRLFDDGHYSEATFEALKFVDKRVQKHSGVRETGVKLMLRVFDENTPVLKLTRLSSVSEIDEQKGYRFLFTGGVLAIRNPRGHEVDIVDDPDTCLDHLVFASLLLRRLEQSGFV